MDPGKEPEFVQMQAAILAAMFSTCVDQRTIGVV